jgi:hypothetical protein
MEALAPCSAGAMLWEDRTMPDDTMSRFERSFRLIGASWGVLRSDRELLVLPVLSAVATIFVVASFGLAAFASGEFAGLQAGRPAGAPDASLYAWLFAFYVVQYTIVIFFNTALVGAALDRLDGGNPTLGSALALAYRRLGTILGYAVISATVGVLLRAISERFGFIGRLVGLGAGLAWTIMTFLVVPVLAAEGIGPVAAIEKSASLLRRSWGENLIGSAGISLVMSVAMAAIMVVGIGGGILSLDRGETATAMLLFAASIPLLLAVMLVGAALSAVYQAAVYYYAVAGEAPGGFDRDLLRSAFGPKGG